MKLIINRSTEIIPPKKGVFGGNIEPKMVFTSQLRVDITDEERKAAGRMGIYTSPLKGISPEETGGSVAKGLAKAALAKLNDRDEMLSLRDMVEKRAVTYTSENPIEVEEYIESFRGILRGVSAYIDMGMNYSDEGSKEEIEELTAET